MTKVQLHYKLSRPLRDADLEGVANVHGVYGIARVQIAPSLDSLTVDYDASRLNEREVETALFHAGLPIERFAPTPADL